MELKSNDILLFVLILVVPVYLFMSRNDTSNSIVNKIKSMESQKIPHDFDYNNIGSLSNESKQKLTNVRPETLGQASRIDGVRSSDISLLCIMLQQYNVPRETL